MKSLVLALLSGLFFTSFLFSQSISWQQLSGPHGGTALSFASTADGNIFAGSDYNQKGVYRSTDNGNNWIDVNNGISLTDRQIECILVNDSGHIFIGTISHIGSIIYKSTDSGSTWASVANLGTNCLTIIDSGQIFAAHTGYQQYHRSTDGGETWLPGFIPLGGVDDIALNDSGHIFLAGGPPFRSTDNGYNWTALNNGLSDGVRSIAINDSGHIFAGSWGEYSSTSGIYRSTNNGDSWSFVKPGFRVNFRKNIVINNNGDIIVGSWGSGIWKSTDNGDTWNQNNSGLGHYSVRSMHIALNGDVYAGLDGGGIYRSTDEGESWTQVGLYVAGVKKIAINSNDNIFTSVWGISRSTDLGMTWEPINNGLGNYDVRALIVKKSNGYLFAGTNDSPNGLIFRSTDNGESWARADNFPTGIAINGLAVGLNGEIIATASGYHNLCQKSTDDGITWQDIKYGQEIGCGKVAFNSAGDLFSASYGGGLWKLPTDDTTWIDLTSNVGSNWIYTFFIGSNDYLYTEGKRSIDNGEIWTTIGNGSFIYSFAENSQGHLFLGTNSYGSGVYRSIDYGETLELINNGLPANIDINALAIDSDNYLYAGTGGKSMFKTTTSTITYVDDINFAPTSFSLEQNYPNPFNPNTIISYTLPNSGNITLKIYDVLGNEVETLVDVYKPAGSYEVEFNTSSISYHLSSGVYFYQLKAGNFVQTKKMLLIK
jgi:photosystem II stability/assembly factor-like uncharacterized protein